MGYAPATWGRRRAGTAAGGEFALPEEAALRDGGSAGVRQSQNLSGLGALSAQAVQLRAGPGEPALGARHLPLDGAEVDGVVGGMDLQYPVKHEDIEDEKEKRGDGRV